jgi:serine/threonine-protein kinase
LDSTLGAPYTALGAIHLWRDWDWEASREAFERALELAPTYAQGHQWYAELLAALGERDRAVAAVKRAAELDPQSPVIHWSVGRVLVFARRFEEAEEQFTRMLESEATRDLGANELLRLYWVQGRQERVFELIESGLVFNWHPDTAAAVRTRFAAGGIRAVFEPWVLSALDGPEGGAAGVGVAGMYALLGHHDAALTALERAWENRAFGKTIPDLVMSPELDAIRSDERYQTVIRSMGLPLVLPE